MVCDTVYQRSIVTCTILAIVQKIQMLASLSCTQTDIQSIPCKMPSFHNSWCKFSACGCKPSLFFIPSNCITMRYGFSFVQMPKQYGKLG